MDQIPKSGFGIRRTHQNLAYQETAETERLKMTQRLWVLQSALANHDSVGRSFANKMLAGFQRNFKGLEIAVVHSDDPGARIQRTTHINGCMHLNERVESELVLRDFVHLDRIDDKIFPEDRQICGGPNGSKIGNRTVEKFLVGKDGDRACPGSVISTGDFFG